MTQTVFTAGKKWTTVNTHKKENIEVLDNKMGNLEVQTKGSQSLEQREEKKNPLQTECYYVENA